MTLVVEPAGEEDLKTLVPIVFSAYGGTHDYINAIFPRNMTKEGEENAIQRCQYLIKVSPAVKWEKCTDTVTGEIIGGAMWIICENAKPPDSDLDGPPGTWENETEKRYAQALHRSCKEEERKTWRENDLPLISLSVMAVKPKHQFRGAGTALMISGMKIADSMGALCTVESTDAGRWLYEKSGFEVKRHRTLVVPEEFADRPKTRLFFMVRKRRPRS